MANYCSYAPEKVFGVDCSLSCMLHDHNYKLSTASRYLCDVTFRQNIINSNLDKPIRAWIVAWVYYLCVRGFGWMFYGKRNDS